MDSDEYDGDDIADEDLFFAATQIPPPTRQEPPSNQQSRVLPASTSQRPQTEMTFPQMNRNGPSQPTPRLGSQTSSLRQTTLFGQFAQSVQASAPSSSNRNRVFRADMPPENPTHHNLDLDALKTWVYPTNLGPTRDYQFSIVKNGLFNNTLVALPTGLGKTFIAATVMLNYFRWMKTAKLVFVAPTKPLVSQQVDACFNIAGIPRSETTLLTGEVDPAVRAEEWESKRVFFMTPQTLENDLSSGSADPKSIGLLVIDEAHRATGNYAYVKVVSFIRRFSSSFRILALTATPGSKVEAVQAVIDGLGVSSVEIRTENSIDIRPYIHQRDEEIILLYPSDEMGWIKEKFTETLKPLVEKLNQQNTYHSRDPMSLTVYGLVKAQQEWMAGPGKGANQGVKFMMMAIFSVLSSLAHAIKLLNFHGIKPFYDNLVLFRDETEAKGQKGSKNKRQIVENKSFQEMMSSIDRWYKDPNFVGHPKLTYLSDTVLNHFMDAGEGREGNVSSNTRIIVFSEYRDSAEEIVRVLNTHKPLIRAAVFVGQADSKKSEGMKQPEQIQRIQKFKEGEFNVLVATSIGEEGLDIGQVDLIICYDASASPIRMLQRMGRTGRKRAGKVVLLLMRGKEEDNYSKSKDGYEKMQQMICDGGRFNFRHDLSTRIVPRGIQPEVDMRAVDIPLENTQQTGLPDPKKRQSRKKKPPKKFHMPDGVETGFQSVGSMLGQAPEPKKKTRTISKEEQEVADIPDLNRVLLSKKQNDELNKMYTNLPYQHRDTTEFIEQIKLTAHPAAQRVRQKTVLLKHGSYTKRAVRLFQTLAKSQFSKCRPTTRNLYKELPLPRYGSDSDSSTEEAPPPPKRRKIDPLPTQRDLEHGSDDDDELEELSIALARARSKKGISTTTAAPSKRATTQSMGVSKVMSKPKNSTSKAPKKPKRPRERSKKASTTAIYDESADEGDDCRRTSDLELTDDSDDGADLEGFIVGDDVATSSNFVTSSAQRHSTSPASPISIPSSNTPTPGKFKLQKVRPYYEPTTFDSEQDYSDDDLPTMSQFIKDKRPVAQGKHSRVDVEDKDDGNEELVRRDLGAPKRRRHVIDDDSDE